MRMKIVWDVTIGDNWETYSIIAPDYIIAGGKARKLARERKVDDANDYVSKVILNTVIDE